MCKFVFVIFVLFLGVGCQSMNPVVSGEERKDYHGDLYSLKDGEGVGMVVKDFWPLDPAKEDDLVEVGLSVPVWESKSEESRDWMRRRSRSGMGVDKWTSGADGAQAAVTVERLSSAPSGAARYRVFVDTGLVGPPMRHDFRLERVAGGWLILSCEKILR